MNILISVKLRLSGDIGGVLGLFLGASIFTVLEFLEYMLRMIHENFVTFRAKQVNQNGYPCNQAFGYRF